jgi:hypothetical protein
MISAVSSTIAAKRTLLVAAVLTSALAVPSVAHAQDRADALFREGRTLLDAKKYDAACPKLAESQKLEPGAGTLLALALCHEGQNKTATAYNELREAAALGRKVGRPELAKAAEKRADSMEPNLAKLVVRVPEGARYDVRCDDDVLQADRLGTPFPVDPGEHRVFVSGTGKKDRSYVVRLKGAGVVEIVVDRLEDNAPAAIAAAPAPRPLAARRVTPLTEPPVEAEVSHGGAQRTIGYALVGLGVVGLGTGAYFGGRAISEHSEASRACPQGPCDDATAANDRAKSSLNMSIVSVTAGTGALALGAILLMTAPSSRPARSARVIPQAGPSQAGVTVVGAF